MDQLRRYHNDHKKELIDRVTRKGDSILDVGCGFGGDLQKWRHAGANINMCEPSEEALGEAKNRAKNMKMRVNFYLGDIFDCPNRKYDIICYNFSLHYIFKSYDLFNKSLREVRKRMKPGGKLIGIIPDSERIIFKTPYKDDKGNFFMMKEESSGNFGEKLWVHLIDTPYFDDGPKAEPIAHKDQLITKLEDMGFKLQTWERLNGYISELYSKFIFVYKNDSTSSVINN